MIREFFNPRVATLFGLFFAVAWACLSLWYGVLAKDDRKKVRGALRVPMISAIVAGVLTAGFVVALSLLP